MEKDIFSEIESKYSELAELNNSKKSNVYLVQNQLDGRIYIKKELKNYNIEVYRQIINIKNLYMARVYEIFQCKDMLVVIEEFINGQTLQHIIDNNGPLNENIAIKYVINLCSILDIIHNSELPIIHRDIKPSNLMIDNNGVLKLIDFDVSRVYKKEKNMDTEILGTKGYASPEQFGFEQTDCRSDIYSLGVLINVLTTGKHIKEKLNSGKLKNIIKKCTNMSPDNRYASVKELKLDLENILNSKEINDNKSNYQELNYKKMINKDKVEEKEDIKNSEKIKYNEVKENRYIYEKEDFVIKDKKNEKNNNLLSIVSSIPGYRSKSAIKIIVATLWYLFLGFGFSSNFGKGDLGLIIEDFAVASLLLGATLFNFNFKYIKSKLPIVRSFRKGNKIAGIIIYNIVMFICCGILLDLAKIF